MNIVFSLAISALALIALACKAKYFAHMLQQNSYRNERYVRWYKSYRSKRKGIYVEALALLLVGVLWQYGYSYGAVALIFVYSVALIARLTYRSQKKPLVVTQRVKRIFVGIAVVLTLVFSMVFVVTQNVHSVIIAALVSILFFPLLGLLANALLSPVEKSIAKRYIKDAKRILSLKKDLKIIAITGSYGKTSTKHFLHTILNQQYTTLMTPGSYNTTMGVVRTIREMLKPIHEVFIVEMGARQQGDIKELSGLVNQDIAILTAIGPQHLETFKSIENVQKGKCEIVAYAKPDALAVLNADYDLVRNATVVQNKDNKIFYTVNEKDKGWHLENISYTEAGMSFDVFDDTGALYLKARTKIIGEYNASNILAAIVVASALGMKKSKIQQGIQNLQPVTHRMELIRRKDRKFTVIDDAFNANPKGTKMALDVLGKIEGQKKYIVTPGMIELGEQQFELNKQFGRHIAQVCDTAVLVGKQQTRPIAEGLAAEGFPEDKIVVVNSLNEAITFINANVQQGDVVLYENDLLDTHSE